MTSAPSPAAPAATSAPRVTAVIAALNEAGSIGSVLSAVKPFVHELLVVDGHSEDDTASIATQHGARVVQDRRRGKGDALRCGADAARGSVLVFIDADGSHDAADIPKLLAPILSDAADLVIGSRMRGGSDELHSDPFEAIRLIGSTVITQAINIRHGVRLTDYQNGFRAIRRDVFLDLHLVEDITTIEQEMAIKALAKGYRVTEIAAHEWARQAGHSKINVMKVAHRYLYELGRDLLQTPRKRG